MRPIVGAAASLVSLALGGCQGSEPVVPFIEAGAPCAVPGHIDCSVYGNITCSADAGACSHLVFGCSDASYFSEMTSCDGAVGDE